MTISLRPDTDLRELVSRAFTLSRPQGMGLLQHSTGGATEAEISSCVRDSGLIAVRADYVRGRSMKLNVYRDEAGALSVDDRWYDHSDCAWSDLLAPYRIAA